MICARECPTWCISIDSHAEPVAGLPSGSRERTRNVLDRFAIDWSLCMYCGICVEECPYDALEWVDDLTQPGLTPESLVEEMVRAVVIALLRGGRCIGQLIRWACGSLTSRSLRSTQNSLPSGSASVTHPLPSGRR